METPWGFPTVVGVIIKLANHKWRYIKHGLLVRETSVNGFYIIFWLLYFYHLTIETQQKGNRMMFFTLFLYCVKLKYMLYLHNLFFT